MSEFFPRQLQTNLSSDDIFLFLIVGMILLSLFLIAPIFVFCTGTPPVHFVGEEQDEGGGAQPNSEPLKLSSHCVGEQRVLKEEDFVLSDTSCDINSEPDIENAGTEATSESEDDSLSFICIPIAGHHCVEEDTPTREVVNECAICISPYKPGEIIMWSPNIDCQHIFHFSCLEQWLVKNTGKAQCPCCRREFLLNHCDLEEGLVGNGC